MTSHKEQISKYAKDKNPNWQFRSSHSKIKCGLMNKDCLYQNKNDVCIICKIPKLHKILPIWKKIK